jgi:hypothetical protein
MGHGRMRDSEPIEEGEQVVGSGGHGWVGKVFGRGESRVANSGRLEQASGCHNASLAVVPAQAGTHRPFGLNAGSAAIARTRRMGPRLRQDDDGGKA